MGGRTKANRSKGESVPPLSSVLEGGRSYGIDAGPDAVDGPGC